jgi:muconate cycloisomerase
LRVIELTAFHVRLALRRRIRHASHARTDTENLIVRCVLEDGTEGFGEGVPREYVTGETVETAIALLRRSDLAAQMEPCRDFGEAVALAERLTLAPVPGDERGCQGNAARCAVELALLDAYGKKFGQPLSAVTHLLTPDLYSPRRWVRYSGAITSPRGTKLRLAAWILRLYWFRDLKVKVGIAGHDDVQRLRIIRRAVGPRMDLRLDVNEAWSAEEVLPRIQALEPFDIRSVEQPVPHAQVDCLAEARRQINTPIMLDESLCNQYDAERAVEQRTCDLFNLRLSKCGGFIPSLRLAQYARRHRLGYQLGCQIGESAVLSAAGRHFASTVADLRYVEGSYDRHLLRDRLSSKSPGFGWGGWASALPGPGLGLTIDPQALKQMTLRKEPILG